jgi:hypothetical protein
MRHRLARAAPWLSLAAIVAFALAAAWSMSRVVPPPEEGDFDFVGWELRNFPNKWLYLAGRAFTGSLSVEEENARLARFLALTASVQEAESKLQDVTGPEAEALREDIEAMRNERDELENDIEAIIEGRLTAVLDDGGLDSSLPLFPDARLVFPPVDAEFDRTPRVLVVSPRSRIEVIDQRPLEQDIASDEAQRIEADEEASGDRSALVLRVAGAATYPSIVEPAADYHELVATIGHEWVHHYLGFKPLGWHYLDSDDLRTMNETVADIVGEELALEVTQRWPLPPDQASPGGPADPARDEAIDRVLGQLRLDVDALLAEGRIAEAEALMEERRVALDAFDVRFRRINQAFLAFRGLYASGPAALDPIGLKLLVLRSRSDSTADFLRSVDGATSLGDLDRLLEDG